MGQVLTADNIPDLVIASTTTITMASSYLGKPTRIVIGGQQYKYSSLTTLNFGTTGFNGLDTGSIAANSLYYIYAVVSSGTPGLVGSLSGPTVGPTGFTFWEAIAICRTLAGAATLSTINNIVLNTDGSSLLYKPGQVPGLNTGTTISPNNIGETGRVALTGTIDTVTLSVYVDDASTFTLQPGVYEIFVNAFCQITTATTNTTPAVAIAIRTSANVQVEQQAWTFPTIATAQSFSPTLFVRAIVNINTATTYKVSVQSNGNATAYAIRILANAVALGGASGTISSYVRWTRIA